MVGVKAYDNELPVSSMKDALKRINELALLNKRLINENAKLRKLLFIKHGLADEDEVTSSDILSIQDFNRSIPESAKIFIYDFIGAVGYSKEQIMSRSKHKGLSAVRHVVEWGLCHLFKFHESEIANFIQRDRTSVLYGISVAEGKHHFLCKQLSQMYYKQFPEGFYEGESN